MFEWQTGEESWEQAHQAEPDRPEPPEKVVSASGKRRLMILLGALTLVIGGISGALRWQGSRGLSRAQTDVQSAIDEEMWARQTSNRALFESLLDPQTPANWRRQLLRNFAMSSGEPSMEITNLVLERPDLALVELSVRPGRGPGHRETRAYRRSGHDWLRTTAPAGQFWIRQQEVETENLRFVFHPADAQVIQEAMDPLQGLYEQLLRDFSLAPPAGKRTLEIALSVRPANIGLDDPRLYDVSHLQSNPDPDALLCQLGSGLADRVLMAFVEGSGTWSYLVDGLRNWELGAWSPACDRDAYARVARLAEEYPFIPLSFLTPEKADRAPAALAETFIDYFVQRYGRDRLADLASTASREDTWSELTEALGLGYVELSGGWWEYLVGETDPGTRYDSEDVRQAIEWMLDLESHAIQTGDRQLFEVLIDPRADQPWRRRVLREFTELSEAETPRWIDLDSLSVKAARVEVVAEIKGPAVGGVRPIYSYPEERWYRYVGGRWVRTSQTEQPETEVHEMETAYLRVQFRAADADFAARLTAGIDKYYANVAADFGISVEPLGDINKVPVEVVHSHIRQFRRGSPITVLWPGAVAEYMHADSPITYSRTNLAYDLGRHLLDTRTEPAAGLAMNLLREAIVRWEVKHRVGHISWLSDSGGAIEAILASDEQLRLPEPSDTEVMQALPLYLTLVDYIAHRYGSERFADLIETSTVHETIRDVISNSIDVDFDVFQTEWRSYVRENYAE